MFTSYLSILRSAEHQKTNHGIKITKLLLVLLSLLWHNGLFSQEKEFIEGQLLDSKTGEPVVFASIYLKNRQVGVISNLDGGFKIPSRYRNTGDILVISSMGYQKQELSVFDLSMYKMNLIRLIPAVFELTEALVTAKKKREPTARGIVRRAIARIPENFPDNRFSTKGYYRDYQLDSLGYLNLNEAFLEIFDDGFNKTDLETTYARLYDYRRNRIFRRDSLADNPYNYENWTKVMDKAYLPAYGGNELVLLRVHDAIRNYNINSFDFIGNMTKGDILKNHSFTRLKDTYIDEEVLYTIALKKSNPGFAVNGKFYISKKNYTIYKLEYSVYDESKKNKDRLLQQKGINGQLLFEVTTEYKRGENDKMYPSYISFHNRFRLAAPPRFFVKSVTVIPEKSTFVVRFNNPLKSVRTGFGKRYGQQGEPNADSRYWYDFRYDDRKLKFEKIEIKDDRTVHLYPKMKADELNEMMGVLRAMGNENKDFGRILRVKVSGLEDSEGNALNAITYKNYDQFREFFVQEVENAPKEKKKEFLMNLRKPIFEDQPVSKPNNFEDYWMNTPLKQRID